MFVEGRDALAGHLSAEPVGLFQQADLMPAPRRCPGGRDASHAAADHEHVARLLASRRFVIDLHDCLQWVAFRRDAHDVEDWVQFSVH